MCRPGNSILKQNGALCLRLVHTAVQSFDIIMNLLEGGFLIGALWSEEFLGVVIMEDGGHRVTHSSFIAPESQCKDSLHIQIHYFNKINIIHMKSPRLHLFNQKYSKTAILRN